MKMRAFNIVPGAAINVPADLMKWRAGDLSGHVVRYVERDVDIEVVYGRMCDGSPYAYAFEDDVDLCGLAIDLSEPNDIGSN